MWNCKGIGTLDFRSNFSYLCNLDKLDLFCVGLKLRSLWRRSEEGFLKSYFISALVATLIAGRVVYVFAETLAQLLLIYGCWYGY